MEPIPAQGQSAAGASPNGPTGAVDADFSPMPLARPIALGLVTFIGVVALDSSGVARISGDVPGFVPGMLLAVIAFLIGRFLLWNGR